MQQLADLDVQGDRGDVRPARKRKASARRKVTVRLSEGVCGRLDVATDRPGVGKSMFVEAALEHFLKPAPSVEALVHERFDQMHARFDRLNPKGDEPRGEAMSEQAPRDSGVQENRRNAASEDIEIAQASRPSAGAVDRNSRAQLLTIHSADT